MKLHTSKQFHFHKSYFDDFHKEQYISLLVISEKTSKLLSFENELQNL